MPFKPAIRRARATAAFVALFIILTQPTPLPGSAGAAATVEQVKATMLLQLTRFVVWPESGSAEFRFCVLGSERFLQTLQAIAGDETVQGRTVSVIRLSAVSEVQGCDLAYVAVASERELQALFSGRWQKSALLVSDLDDFATRGGMVGFVTEAGRLGLELNRESAEKAGLQFSSRLLKLARLVRTSGGR